MAQTNTDLTREASLPAHHSGDQPGRKPPHGGKPGSVDASNQTTPERTPTATAAQPKSILVIDDDPGIRDALQDVLELENYKVYTADNGQHALSILETIERPNLILLDLMMPVMTGWQFLQSVKADQRHASIPVVVFSAASEKKGDLSQATAIVRKPVEVDGLIEIVEKHAT